MFKIGPAAESAAWARLELQQIETAKRLAESCARELAEMIADGESERFVSAMRAKIANYAAVAERRVRLPHFDGHPTPESVLDAGESIKGESTMRINRPVRQAPESDVNAVAVAEPTVKRERAARPAVEPVREVQPEPAAPVDILAELAAMREALAANNTELEQLRAAAVARASAVEEPAAALVYDVDAAMQIAPQPGEVGRVQHNGTAYVICERPGRDTSLCGPFAVVLGQSGYKLAPRPLVWGRADQRTAEHLARKLDRHRLEVLGTELLLAAL